MLRMQLRGPITRRHTAPARVPIQRIHICRVARPHNEQPARGSCVIDGLHDLLSRIDVLKGQLDDLEGELAVATQVAETAARRSRRLGERAQQFQQYAVQHVYLGEEGAARDALRQKAAAAEALSKANDRARLNCLLAGKLEQVIQVKQNELIQLVRQAKQQLEQQETAPAAGADGSSTTAAADSTAAAGGAGGAFLKRSSSRVWSSPTLHTVSSLDGAEGGLADQLIDVQWQAEPAPADGPNAGSGPYTNPEPTGGSAAAAASESGGGSAETTAATTTSTTTISASEQQQVGGELLDTPFRSAAGAAAGEELQVTASAAAAGTAEDKELQVVAAADSSSTAATHAAVEQQLRELQRSASMPPGDTAAGSLVMSWDGFLPRPSTPSSSSSSSGQADDPAAAGGAASSSSTTADATSSSSSGSTTQAGGDPAAVGEAASSSSSSSSDSEIRSGSGSNSSSNSSSSSGPSKDAAALAEDLARVQSLLSRCEGTGYALEDDELAAVLGRLQQQLSGVEGRVGGGGV